MKAKLSSIVASAALATTAVIFTSCDVDKKADGEMPKVDVEAGKLPEYEVNTPTVEIGKKTVEVPTIEVKPAEDGDDN